jgi:DNA-binding transcriptional LysR family regulator
VAGETAKLHNRAKMDWNDLRYFLAIARAGTTAAAARVLGVNQSTVVRRLAALESALGLTLFHKKREGYRLTGEGEALLPEVEAIEARVQTLDRRAAALQGAQTGSLRVTTAEGMALGLVPQFINGFRLRHPGIEVTLLIDDRYHDLDAGEADIALRAGPPGNESLVGRRLSDICWAVYASRSYLERAGRPAHPAALNEHKVVGFEGVIEHIKPACWLRSVAPRCDTVTRSGSVLGLLFAAQSGFGLTLLPCHVGDQEPGLVRVIGPLPELTGDFWILTSRRLHRQSKVRAFLDFMSAEMVKYRPLLRGETGLVNDPAASAEPGNEASL